jgi:hypothetical protein
MKKEAEEAEKRAVYSRWVRDFRSRFIIKADIGEFKYQESGGATREPGQVVAYELTGPDVAYGDSLYSSSGKNVWASVFEVASRDIPIHDFLRRIVRGHCSIVRSEHGTCVRSIEDEGAGTKRYWRAWLSSKTVAFYIYSVHEDPHIVAQGYLQRFPSIVPAELTIDKKAWGREEMEFWLSLMRRNLDAGDPDRLAKTHFQGCIYNLRQYVLLPPEVVAVRKEDTLEVKQKAYDFLCRWWEQNKEKSYWHKGYRKLAVKGYTPEDLAEAEQKRQEAEIKAKLDAELTDEDVKRITPAVVRKLEAWMQYLVDLGNKTLGPDSGCKFEKVGDGEWRRYFRECNGCALYRQTITGPTLRRWRDRKCPLLAEFRCVNRNLDTGKDSEEKIDYHYRKLEDLWSEGPPPK